MARSNKMKNVNGIRKCANKKIRTEAGDGNRFHLLTEPWLVPNTVCGKSVKVEKQVALPAVGRKMDGEKDLKKVEDNGKPNSTLAVPLSQTCPGISKDKVAELSYPKHPLNSKQIPREVNKKSTSLVAYNGVDNIFSQESYPQDSDEYKTADEVQTVIVQEGVKKKEALRLAALQGMRLLHQRHNRVDACIANSATEYEPCAYNPFLDHADNNSLTAPKLHKVETAEKPPRRDISYSKLDFSPAEQELVYFKRLSKLGLIEDHLREQQIMKDEQQKIECNMLGQHSSITHTTNYNNFSEYGMEFKPSYSQFGGRIEQRHRVRPSGATNMNTYDQWHKECIKHNLNRPSFSFQKFIRCNKTCLQDQCKAPSCPDLTSNNVQTESCAQPMPFNVTPTAARRYGSYKSPNDIASNADSKIEKNLAETMLNAMAFKPVGLGCIPGKPNCNINDSIIRIDQTVHNMRRFDSKLETVEQLMAKWTLKDKPPSTIYSDWEQCRYTMGDMRLMDPYKSHVEKAH